MCHSTLATYCFIDGFLKQSGYTEDIRVEFTDAEVITIALTAMLHFGGNFEKSRRINCLADLIHLLFHQLDSVLKDLHWESHYILDSFPVPICDNIRINRCRIIKDEQYRGKVSSKRRYFLWCESSDFGDFGRYSFGVLHPFRQLF